MGFFNRLAKIIFPPKEVVEEPQQEVQQEHYQVYCQYCGGDLTENGGDISFSGKIYCNKEYMLKRAPCGMIAFIRGMDDYEHTGMKYKDSTEVQEAIQEGELTQFSELEKKVEES